MNDRFYDAVGALKKTKKKYPMLMYDYRTAVKLADGQIVYVTGNYYNQVLLIGDSCVHLMREEYVDIADRRMLLEGMNETYSRDWIGVCFVGKQDVSEEQKQTYLAYAREKHIKVGGLLPYPVVELHEHNRTFSQDVSEAQIEEATLVLEAINAIINDNEKRAKFVQMVTKCRLDNASFEGKYRVPCIDMRAKNAPALSKITVQKPSEKIPEVLSGVVEGKIAEVMKLQRAGTAQIVCGYPRKVCDYLFDTGSVVPTVFFIDDCDREQPEAGCILTDYIAQRETVWLTMLDFFIRRGERPETVYFCGNSLIALDYLCLAFLERLEIFTEYPDRTGYPVENTLMNELDSIEDREYEAKSNYLYDSEDRKSESYIFRVTLTSGPFDFEKAVREIRMDSLSTFGDLHDEIQMAFGFDNDHGFYFKVRGLKENESIGGFPDGMELEGLPSAFDVYLAEAGFKKGSKFKYVFDIGDYWTFEIKVKDVLQENTQEPILVSSEGENPEQYPCYE